MSEIEIGGVRYRVNRMNVFDQAHVARKVAPIIFSMGRGYAQALSKLPQRPEPTTPEYTNGEADGMVVEAEPTNQDVAEENAILFDTLGPIADVLSKMSDEDVDYVLKKCLTVCQKHNGSNWAPLMRNGNLMFDDLDLATLMQLSMEVVQDNLGPSLRGLLGQNSEPTEGLSVEYASMNDEIEEWCLAPVHAGMCRYESLIDGTLSLHDISRMNEFLSVRSENEARVADAQRDQQHG